MPLTGYENFLPLETHDAASDEFADRGCLVGHSWEWSSCCSHSLRYAIDELALSVILGDRAQRRVV